MTQNSMEVVQEGILESISRPTSSSTRYGHTFELTSRPSTRESSFVMELLPADSIPNSFLDEEKMEIEDVVDSDIDINECCAENSVEIAQLSIGEETTRATPETEEDIPFVKDEQAKDTVKLEPKIVRGLKKIKKLDSLLEEVGKKEKEVKNERRKVERELRLELRSLLEQHGSVSRKVGTGVQQLLALCEGDENQHNTESVRSESITDGFSPLFQTQVEVGDDVKEEQFETETTNASNYSEESSLGCGSKNEKKGTKSKRNKKCKDKTSKNYDISKQNNFIERNIKLASHAGDSVALTDEERKRIDELLEDESDFFSENSPQSIASLSTGFGYDSEATLALSKIDSQLRDLIPDGEYNSICFTPRSEFSLNDTCAMSTCTSEKQSDFSYNDTRNSSGTSEFVAYHLSNKTIENVKDDNEHYCGEQVLHEARQYREIKQRLALIEEQLTNFHSDATADENAQPTISNELLRQLLDVDSRSTSTALSIMDVVSGRLSVSDDSVLDNTSCMTPSQQSEHPDGDAVHGVINESMSCGLMPPIH